MANGIVVDVVDPSGNPGEQNVGKQLIIDGKYEYSDLDELIVNHVNAMARKVEELIAHEKYKAGSEAELREFTRFLVCGRFN